VVDFSKLKLEKQGSKQGQEGFASFV